MTEVAGDIQKILTQDVVANNPTSQALFSLIAANINALIDSFGQFQVFTSSGTFNVPENVSRVFVLGWGGGQSGSRAGASTGRVGGRGAVPMLTNVAVTPLSSITVTIGAGGSGATNLASGGNTTFGSLLTFGGAGANERAGLFYSSGGVSVIVSNGQSSLFALGGSSFSNLSAGGGAGLGPGANGPASSEQAGNSAAANSGAGGSSSSSASALNSGNGGSGGLVVFF